MYLKIPNFFFFNWYCCRQTNRKLTFPNTKRENPRRTYPELTISFPSRDVLSLSAAPKASSSSKLFLYVCKCVKIIWKLIAPQKPRTLPTAAARERQRAAAADVGLRMRPRVCRHVRWRRPAACPYTGYHGPPAPRNPPVHAPTRRGTFCSSGSSCSSCSRVEQLALPRVPLLPPLPGG